jgi:hypothetical protein
MKNTVLIITLGLLTSLSACKKDDVAPSDSSNKSMSELNVSSGFDWKTTTNVSLTLTGYANSTAEILNSDGDLIQKVFLKKNEPFTAQVALPKATKSIKLRFLGQTVELEVTSVNVSYIFN